jgi:iron-sulfur cluster assembly accessory protein
MDSTTTNKVEEHRHAPADEVGSEPVVTLTEKAKEKVLVFMKEDENNKGKALRVYVEGGGCAGFQYGLAFDDKKDGDEVVSFDGFEVAVDPMSAMYLRGAKVDFVEGLYGTGFKIDNPNATGGCGCGHSFTV